MQDEFPLQTGKDAKKHLCVDPGQSLRDCDTNNFGVEPATISAEPEYMYDQQSGPTLL